MNRIFLVYVVVSPCQGHPCSTTSCASTQRLPPRTTHRRWNVARMMLIVVAAMFAGLDRLRGPRSVRSGRPRPPRHLLAEGDLGLRARPVVMFRARLSRRLADRAPPRRPGGAGKTHLPASDRLASTRTVHRQPSYRSVDDETSVAQACLRAVLPGRGCSATTRSRGPRDDRPHTLPPGALLGHGCCEAALRVLADDPPPSSRRPGRASRTHSDVDLVAPRAGWRSRAPRPARRGGAARPLRSTVDRTGPSISSVGRNFSVEAARSTSRVTSVWMSAAASAEPRAKIDRRMSLIVASRSSTAASMRSLTCGHLADVR